MDQHSTPAETLLLHSNQLLVLRRTSLLTTEHLSSSRRRVLWPPPTLHVVASQPVPQLSSDVAHAAEEAATPPLAFLRRRGLRVRTGPAGSKLLRRSSRLLGSRITMGVGEAIVAVTVNVRHWYGSAITPGRSGVKVGRSCSSRGASYRTVSPLLSRRSPAVLHDGRRVQHVVSTSMLEYATMN